MASWADLDKLAMARPRPDGRVTVVATDGRPPEAIAETQHLSTLVAISRVLRGRRVIEELHGGRGVVVYQCRPRPPTFLIDAVTAAGGVVFDGTSEHVSPKPLELTVQLDAAFCDLATATRRRLKVSGYGDALDVREAGLRQKPVDATDSVAYWTAIFELIALTGEVARTNKPGRWVEIRDQRLPLALDLGGGIKLVPANLAAAIAGGSGGSLRSLLTATAAESAPAIASRQAIDPRRQRGAPRRQRGAKARPMPLLCARGAVPLDHLSWTPLVDAEVDHPSLPVVVWVEDRGETIHWPTDRGLPSAELQLEALRNLEAIAVEITPLELPFATLAVVTGDFFAAETMLAPATMQRVREVLGGAPTLLVATPARGHLLAIDASRALVDDDLMASFMSAVEREHLRAADRDRISSAVVVYHERPLGRVQSNLFEARQALRDIGVDPDAPDADGA